MFQQFITLGVIQHNLKLLLKSLDSASVLGLSLVLAFISSFVLPVVVLVAWQTTAHLAIVALCVGSVLAWDNAAHPNLFTAGIVHGTIVAMLYWRNGVDPLASLW